MAGIGFELKRAIHETSYVGTIRGYLFAAVISSGPWLLSILTMALLGVISIAFLPYQERDLIAGTTTHAFALSLVTTGVIQMFVTRFLADKLYVEEPESIAPAYVSVLVISSAAQFLFIMALFSRTTLPLTYQLPAAAFYVAICGIWLSMVFLSAARDYVTIVACFAVGYAISFVGAYTLGTRFGASGYMFGFAGGQVALLAMLLARVLAEFDSGESFGFSVFTYVKRYPALVSIGLIYNLAFWIDKVVFWFSPEGISVNSFLNVFPAYDSSFFLASLTIVPALAIFIVNIETDFYNHYKSFYARIMNKHDWDEIVRAKDGMIASVRGSYITLFKLQTAIVLLGIALGPAILTALGTPHSHWYIFRVAMLAIGVQVFLLNAVMVLLYLDLRGSVLTISLLFLVLNFGFTIVTLRAGYAYYGYGFLYASVICLIVAMALLRNRFQHLEYLTFTRQPLDPEK